MPIPFIGPLLIAAGTAAVGSLFQNQSDRISQKRAKREAILSKAGEVYDDVSSKVDTLHYYLVEEAFYIAIRSALDDKSRSDVDATGWKAYQQSLVDWKTNQHRLSSEVHVYFGQDNADLFRSIGDRFDESDSRIGATFYKTSNSMIKKFKDKEGARLAFFEPLKTIKQDIGILNQQMTDLLQKQQVGDLRNKDKSTSYFL